MGISDKEIRAWAIENHKNVGKRGRISEDLRKAYLASLPASPEEANDD